jgi:serine/threonine-protein kinase
MKNVFGKNKFFIIGYVVVFFIFCFVLFNWVMSAIIHAKKEVIVPKIEGKTVVEALSALSKLNLGLKKVGETHSKTLPSGTIVSQFPPSGMTVREGKIINVVISLGSELLYIPNLKNLTERAAKIKIKKTSFKLGKLVYSYSAKIPKGLVIHQEPPPDTIAPKMTEINLTISQGPPPASFTMMPDFVGKDINFARRWAEENNITCFTFDTSNENFPLNVVVEQKPPPDSIVTDKTILRLWVNTTIPTKKIYTYFTYTLPLGKKEMKVKLIMIDEHGETVLFERKEPGGTKITVPIRKPKGKAKLRFFIDDVLVEEKEI